MRVAILLLPSGKKPGTVLRSNGRKPLMPPTLRKRTGRQRWVCRRWLAMHYTAVSIPLQPLGRWEEEPTLLLPSSKRHQRPSSPPQQRPLLSQTTPH